MIRYHIYDETLAGLTLAKGFFNGWPKPPDAATHKRILSDSYLAIVAVDEGSQEIVGFINVLSDGILSAYIPLLEVVPAYQNQGIGRRLMEMAMVQTKHLYMLDLVCDVEMVTFYEGLGLQRGRAMLQRNYEAQSGRQE